MDTRLFTTPDGTPYRELDERGIYNEWERVQQQVPDTLVEGESKKGWRLNELRQHMGRLRNTR